MRAFATLRGRKAKNDRLDAQLIAEFAARFGEAREPRPAAWEKLAELLTYYEQVAEDAARLRTCLSSLHDPEIRDRATARLTALGAEKTALLKRLRALVAELPELAARVKLRSRATARKAIRSLMVWRAIDESHSQDHLDYTP